LSSYHLPATTPQNASLPLGTAGSGDQQQEQQEHVLNRYFTLATGPRPESYKEDMTTKEKAVSSFSSHAQDTSVAQCGSTCEIISCADGLLGLVGLIVNWLVRRFATCPKVSRPNDEVLADIAAAAESGWDFSSRWILDPRVRRGWMDGWMDG
jgi:neutral trehalase